MNTRFDFIENIISQSNTTSLRQLAKADDITQHAVTYHQTKESFLANVKTAQEYIYAGDAFQIVLSQRLSMPFYNDYFEFYRTLRRLNPSPYMFYFNHGDFVLAGASPEILVRNDNGTITIRPIAGTRPRGITPEQDKQFEIDLLNDPKEIAEHLMLLDLGRNDVGRISEIGTVVVTDEYVIERYSHVMHIVSNVTGKLQKNCDFIDAFFSALPAGTVSGAPKIRAMEIINELETEKRGFYAGGIGYFSSNGNGDFSIMLRTSLLKDNVIYFQAGAGVVADSDPTSEYTETLNKAKATIKAAQIARHGNY
jgi:anthranilate synthase component 1